MAGVTLKDLVNNVANAQERLRRYDNVNAATGHMYTSFEKLNQHHDAVTTAQAALDQLVSAQGLDPARVAELVRAKGRAIQQQVFDEQVAKMRAEKARRGEQIWQG